MQNTLIEQGLSLTLFGMGTVFTFLTLMVFATTLMSRLVAKYAPEPEEPEVQSMPSSDKQAIGAIGSVDNKTLMIIKKAISAHRQR